MLAPSVSYQISSLLWTRVSFEQSRCCSPHRLQGVRQLSEAGSAAMGVFHDYSGWGPLAIGLAPRSSRSTVRWFHQHVFEALRGSPLAEGFFPPFPYSGEEEEGKLVQSVYWRNGFRSSVCKVPGGEEQGWVVLLFACRGVARIFNSAVIRPHCL